MSQEDKKLTKSDIAEMREVEESLAHAPDEGTAVSDYFGFAEVFRRVLSTADHELNVRNKYLFASALGAGGAIGLTFIARILFTYQAGEPLPALMGNLMYPVGFIIIVLGRYQLFTENTLTPVVLVLTRLASLRDLARLWLVVLAGNMVGGIAVAAVLAYTPILSEGQHAVANAIGHHVLEATWWEAFSRAIVAGCIVAAMVWLVHAVRDSFARVAVVFLLMYFLGVCGFYHIITSSLELFYLAFMEPETSFWAIWPNFVIPVFIGNCVGGIVFVAVLNYAQFSEHGDAELFKKYGSRLPAKEWCFGSGMDRKNATAAE